MSFQIIKKNIKKRFLVFVDILRKSLTILQFDSIFHSKLHVPKIVYPHYHTHATSQAINTNIIDTSHSSKQYSIPIFFFLMKLRWIWRRDDNWWRWVMMVAAAAAAVVCNCGSVPIIIVYRIMLCVTNYGRLDGEGDSVSVTCGRTTCVSVSHRTVNQPTN